MQELPSVTYSPSFAPEVSLVEVAENQLKQSIRSMCSTIENLSHVGTPKDAITILQRINPPEHVCYERVSFHWNPHMEMGFYVPFDVLPMTELLGGLLIMIQKNGGNPFFSEIRNEVEQRYQFVVGNFGGPVAFTTQLPLPESMCVVGRITPRRVAVWNPHRNRDVRFPTDSIFGEFAEAVREDRYPCLYVLSCSREVENFLSVSCIDAGSLRRAVEDADQDSSGEWTPPRADPEEDAPPPPARNDEEVPVIDTPPEVYRAMQHRHAVQMRAKRGELGLLVQYTLHFPDTHTQDVSATSRFKTLQSIEYFLREKYKDKVWAEVIACDSQGARLNHLTFETFLQTPRPCMDIYMHRFLTISTVVRIIAEDYQEQELGSVCVILEHRTYDELMAQARSVGGARLGIQDIANRKYTADVVDRPLDSTEDISVTFTSYGTYLRAKEMAMMVVFTAPSPMENGGRSKRPRT
jgi:hypothetical protein